MSLFTYKWLHFCLQSVNHKLSWVKKKRWLAVHRSRVSWEVTDNWLHTHDTALSLVAGRWTLVEPPRISTRTVNELCWLLADGSNIYHQRRRRLRSRRLRKDKDKGKSNNQSNSNTHTPCHNNSKYNKSNSRTMWHKSNRITTLIAAQSVF